MMEIRKNTNKEIKPAGHKYETRNAIKLLSSPAPSLLLTLKQKKSLFLKAAYTALNYLGYPTESCKTDCLDMFKFINCLFHNLLNMDKKSIYHRAKSLPAPEFVVITEVIQAVLLNHVVVKESDTIYCKVGTDANNLQLSKGVKASYAPQWNQEFFIKTDFRNTNIMIEVWLKSTKGKHSLIGTAYQDTKHIPSTGDEICVFLMDNIDPIVNQGYIYLCCFYNVVQLHLKVNIIFQHIMFCYLCYEYQINNLQKLSPDVTNHEPPGLYECGLKKLFSAEIITFLHQHALQHGLTPFENLMCCYIVVCQYFVKTAKASLTNVDILLHEITSLGKNPQKALDAELKATLMAEISSSVDKCCQLLCNIFSETEKEENEPLDLILKYLVFVQEYYLESTVKKITERIQSSTEFRPVEILALSESSTKFSREVMDNFVDKIFNALHTLKTADAVFSKELDINYTSIMYEKLDKMISEFFSSALETASEGLDNRSLEEITLFMEIYFFFNDLILHFANHLPSPELLQQMGVLAYHQVLGAKVFHSYLHLLSSKSEPRIISWIENDQCDDGESPFDEYIKMLLNHWKNLAYRARSSPTVALIQIVEGYCKRFCQLLNENLWKNFNKENKIKSEIDVVIELTTCICLNKMENISSAVNTMCQKVQVTLKGHNFLEDHLEKKLEDLTSECYIERVYVDIQEKLGESIQKYLLSVVDTDSKDFYDEAKIELAFYLEGILTVVGNTLNMPARKKIFEIVTLVLREKQKSFKYTRKAREILEHLQLLELVFEKNAI